MTLRIPDFDLDPEARPMIDGKTADELEAEAWRVTRRAFEYHGFGRRAAQRFGSLIHPTVTDRTVRTRIAREGWKKLDQLGETPKTKGARIARTRRSELATERNEESAETLLALRDELIDRADDLRFHTRELVSIAACVVKITSELRALDRDQLERDQLADGTLSPDAAASGNYWKTITFPEPDELPDRAESLALLGLPPDPEPKPKKKPSARKKTAPKKGSK